MTEHTKPNEETRQADRDALNAEHTAGQEPTPEEEQAAERNTVSPETPEHYQEMTERGANQQGEGRI
ncbi:MAG TPA: hypothetical protein VM938_04180 [Acidimicrobiales bacterium]|nr:hypothetical protein [Acidimicrobiales bacterium]